MTSVERKRRWIFLSILLFSKGDLPDAFFDYSYRNSFFFLEQIRAINHTENSELDLNKLAINSKQETICIISTHPSPNPPVPQNIAWQYNVTNLT